MWLSKEGDLLVSHPSQSNMKNRYLYSGKFLRLWACRGFCSNYIVFHMAVLLVVFWENIVALLSWKTHTPWASSECLTSSSWDSYTPLSSQYSCLEGNQNTFDAIQSRLPLSGMHQEVFPTIMFLQNKFHWEAFDHPECMGCNLKACRAVYFIRSSDFQYQNEKNEKLKITCTSNFTWLHCFPFWYWKKVRSR